MIVYVFVYEHVYRTIVTFYTLSPQETSSFLFHLFFSSLKLCLSLGSVCFGSRMGFCVSCHIGALDAYIHVYIVFFFLHLFCSIYVAFGTQQVEIAAIE